tara:strand:- start:699418 stop:700011 length:594 start_codon:yes stop_codon:yes gene_type:complete
MNTIIAKYVPENAIELVAGLLKQYPCTLKIVNGRKTKHGDFRQLPSGKYQITINNDLNQYRFLLTLVHELAHLVTHKHKGKVKPHGVEWRQHFQHLMLPCVNPRIYPKEVLPFLAHYLIKPKASTDADVNLSLVLKQYDERNGKSFIFEVPLESKFVYNKRVFLKGAKRRTRYGCVEVSTGKTYLFHQNAEVDLVKN